MKVLILSKDGRGTSIAHRLSTEGHHVDLWIDNPAYKDMLCGIVSRPVSWRPLVAEADLVICDTVGFSEYASIFKRLGKPVLCCNPITDVLSIDKQRYADVLQLLKINSPVSISFNNSIDAAQMRWTNPSGYIIKALDITHLCETPEIYQWALTTFPVGTKFIVQEVISPDEGISIRTEGWFNGVDWIHPFNHTFEESYNSGSAVLPVEHSNKLIESTIARFKPLLLKSGYRGPVGIDCIVTKDAVYATKLNCCFSFNAFDALMTGLKEPLGAFLFDTATGIKKSMDIQYDFLLSVQVEKDLCDKYQSRGMPICGLTDTDLKFTYLSNIYRHENQLLYAAANGVILKATAFGRSIKEAQHRAYRICSNIKALDISYRMDVGNRVDGNLKLLREWGWV